VKALLLAHSNGGGGAGRAAQRLFTALDAAGTELSMHVDFRDAPDPRVFTNSGPLATARRRARITVEEVPAVLARHPAPRLFSPGLCSAISARRVDAEGADIVSVHWTNFGYLSVRQLARIRTPLVWTMHDMWALTGGRNYDDDSAEARWRHGYVAGNRPDDGTRWDVERWVWNRKVRSWTAPRHLIAPSRWLAGLVADSPLLSDWPVHVIPNALDTNHFRARSRQESRARLGIGTDAQVALMTVGGDVTDPRKGIDLLLESLAAIPPAIEIAVVGSGSPPPGWPDRPTHWLGYLDDERIVDAYCAADVAVVPSRQDNLPQTATEPQACGTPVVAFGVGGLDDIVVHRETGWLATPGSSRMLAEGIAWVLEDEDRRLALGAAARARAVERWDAPVVAAEHLRVFEQVAQERRS
jgi:glycosyltransferase involved in cell wall biosynthesis